jgi:NhaP-type Na+/H+ or K+/H+ antiporter
VTAGDAWLLALCVAGLLVALGATSGLVNTRLWVSEPLVCAAAGVALGPVGFGLLHFDPGSSSQDAAILREVARVTLAVSVTGAAMRLPRGWMTAQWRGLAVALGPGMLLMWAVGSLVTAAALELPPLVCLLVGAAIAPTDPVLSAPVVTGKLARKAVPDDLRHAITAESGANDGLALLLVALPILLLTEPSLGVALLDWVLHTLLWEVGAAVAVGAAIGWLACHVLRWARQRPDAERASLLTVALSLSITTLAAMQVLGGSGILAAFVAGAMLKEALEDEQQERQEHFNEAFGRFFDLPIMILFGIAAPWAAWGALGWRGAAFAAGIVLLRRLPAWLLLRRWMPWTQPLPQALFAGWFGPVGAAALFYACDAQARTGIAAIWPAVSLAAAASVLAHGVTGTHLSALLGRVRQNTMSARRIPAR